MFLSLELLRTLALAGNHLAARPTFPLTEITPWDFNPGLCYSLTTPQPLSTEAQVSSSLPDFPVPSSGQSTLQTLADISRSRRCARHFPDHRLFCCYSLATPLVSMTLGIHPPITIPIRQFDGTNRLFPALPLGKFGLQIQGWIPCVRDLAYLAGCQHPQECRRLTVWQRIWFLRFSYSLWSTSSLATVGVNVGESTSRQSFTVWFGQHWCTCW